MGDFICQRMNASQMALLDAIFCFNNQGGKAIQAIEAAFRDYHAKTCLRFVKRTNQRDYIVFNAKSG